MLQSYLPDAVFLCILHCFGESVKDEPMILVALALATVMSSQQREAEVLIGGDPCVHPSFDWGMIEYLAVRVQRSLEQTHT